MTLGLPQREEVQTAQFTPITQQGNDTTRFKLAPHWLMEEIQWRNNTAVETQHTSSYSTLSLTFIMCPIVCVCERVCACVIETHLWKQLSWPPSPLPHPVPAVSQQLTATYCPPPLSLCNSHIPVHLLVSFSLNLTLSSLHTLIFSYLSCRQFPPLQSIS